MQVINLTELDKVEVAGVIARDYPGFSDAYFASARWKASGNMLSEVELAALSEQQGVELNRLALEQHIEKAIARADSFEQK